MLFVLKTTYTFVVKVKILLNSTHEKHTFHIYSNEFWIIQSLQMEQNSIFSSSKNIKRSKKKTITNSLDFLDSKNCLTCMLRNHWSLKNYFKEKCFTQSIKNIRPIWFLARKRILIRKKNKKTFNRNSLSKIICFFAPTNLLTFDAKILKIYFFSLSSGE